MLLPAACSARLRLGDPVLNATLALVAGMPLELLQRGRLQMLCVQGNCCRASLATTLHRLLPLPVVAIIARNTTTTTAAVAASTTSDSFSSARPTTGGRPAGVPAFVQVAGANDREHDRIAVMRAVSHILAPPQRLYYHDDRTPEGPLAAPRGPRGAQLCRRDSVVQGGVGWRGVGGAVAARGAGRLQCGGLALALADGRGVAQCRGADNLVLVNPGWPMGVALPNLVGISTTDTTAVSQISVLLFLVHYFCRRRQYDKAQQFAHPFAVVMGQFIGSVLLLI